MIPELRRRFLEHWTPELYRQFLAGLESSYGRKIDFRISETPVFFPRDLVEKMARYGQELYAQLAVNSAYLQASDATVPKQFRVPNEAQHPLFVQADFGLVRSADGALEPKLVEIQGFPSIYALQCAMAEAYARTYGLDPNLEYLFDGLDKAAFVKVFHRAIVGEHDPTEVALLEIDPYAQKTAADFIETQRMLGIRICPVTEVEKRGRQLYHQGRPIRRIYNRVVVDELVRRNIQLGFDFTDDLEVEWAGHPNWFFRLSKFSLPWFDHPCVPRTRFLNQVDRLPDDLENFVLKPLFSFAGLGVTVGPERAEIEAIPKRERGDWILQERMRFVPTLETPSGLTTVETRIMYVLEDERLRPLLTVVRTGRGKMMGVDFNKNLDWVGASAGFFPPRD